MGKAAGWIREPSVFQSRERIRELYLLFGSSKLQTFEIQTTFLKTETT